jgi:exodeoxyribonuclease VII large subunit
VEAAQAAGAPPQVHSVYEIVHRASRTLQQKFSGVWVEGELSNFRRIASGHLFFSLKDDRAQLPAVMFRGDARRLAFAVEDGIAVRCRGSLRIYEAQGRFQLYVEHMEPVGLGALMLAFEQLKRKLRAEGLFSPERKRPLPRFPRGVGVVTSPTGAALRDILQVAARRFPTWMLVSPTPVQGAEAAPRIIAALQAVARVPGIEVIILGRGGGSMEDLWCFNDEALTRAVAACPLPVVSAVGHEIDFTLCDYVADRRAPTPSAAAELVLPDRVELARHLEAQRERLRAAARGRLDDKQLRLGRLAHRLGDPRPRLLDARATLEQLRGRQQAALQAAVDRRRRRLARLREGVAHGHPRSRLTQRRGALERQGARLEAAMRAQLGQRRQRLEGAERARLGAGRTLLQGPRRSFAVLVARLKELSPLQVLARGYALAMDASGRAVRRYTDVDDGDPLRVRLAEGELRCTVQQRLPPDAPGPGPEPGKGQAAPDGDGGDGDASSEAPGD